MISTSPRNTPAAETITFERVRAPLAIFFVVVPAVLLLMIGVTFVNYKFPLALYGLLGAVGATCLVWIKLALDNIGNVAVELGAQQLSIKRLVGSTCHDWHDIELIKLVDPGATLADSGRQDEGRVGLGLYLKSKAEQRADDAAPDEMIITANHDGAGAVIKASERLIAFHRKAAAGKGAAASGFGRTGKGFRRPAKAA